MDIALKNKLNPSRFLAFFCIIGTIIFIAGCASSSIFLPYPTQAAAYKTGLNNSKLENSLQKLDKKRTSSDKVLYLMERGRLNQLSNNFDESLDDFKTVIEQFNLQDDKARVTATGSMNVGSSLLTNDNAIPYKGDAYERVLVYHYQAMNYLAKGDRSAALVEVRRANLEQNFALQQHERELAKAEKEAEKKQPASEPGQYDNYFSSMDQMASKVKSSFQNAYTFYLSGLIYEANGNYNDAYIDYKKAIEIFPGNPYLQDDVLRLAKQLGMRDDLRRYNKLFEPKAARNSSSTHADSPGANTGTLVIIYEHGYVSQKQEISLPLFTSQGLQQVSFPVYKQAWSQPPPLKISVNNLELKSSTIVYASALAVKALKEKIPGMIIRQTLRAIAKKELQNQANEQGGAISFTTQIYNLISERADLRSWLTLPNDVQIARIELKTGQKNNIQFATTSQSENIEIDIRPGQITILRLTDTGTRIIKQLIPL